MAAGDINDDDFLWFGKWRDFSVAHVMGQDPQYLLWAHENVDDFDLSPLTLQRVERAADDWRNKPGNTTRQSSRWL